MREYIYTRCSVLTFTPYLVYYSGDKWHIHAWRKGGIQMSEWLFFLLGLGVGAVFATLILACLLANRLGDEREKRRRGENEPGTGK